MLDDPQCDGDLLLGHERKLERGELLAGGPCVQPREAPCLDGDAVVKQHGVDALQPLGALTNECLAQPDLRAQIQNVRRRDPRLRQAVCMSSSRSSRASSLSVFARRLRFLTHPRLRRLGEARLDADTDAFLGDEPPARHRLNRDDRFVRRQPRQQRAHRSAAGRTNPASPHLPGIGVKRCQARRR
jgi:hypothetical protein